MLITQQDFPIFQHWKNQHLWWRLDKVSVESHTPAIKSDILNRLSARYDLLLALLMGEEEIDVVVVDATWGNT